MDDPQLSFANIFADSHHTSRSKNRQSIAINFFMDKEGKDGKDDDSGTISLN